MLSLSAHGLALAWALAAPRPSPPPEPLPIRLLLLGGDSASVDPAPSAQVVSPAPPPRAPASKPRAPAARPRQPPEAPRPAAPTPVVAEAEAGVIGPPTGETRVPEPVELAAVAPAGAGAGGRRLFSEGEVDGLAMPAQRVRPRYPERARLLGRESEVKVAVTVEASGAVSNVAVLKSGGEEFDREALDAVRRERWVPAMRAGEPVAAVVTFEVRFRLDD